MPLAAVVGGLIDFSIAFAVLVVMMVYYGIFPTLNMLFLPFFLLFSIATTLTVGLWLSALNVIYRDVQYVVPFLVQFWLFATPIVYPSTLVPPLWRPILGINPMAGVVEGFRWSLLGSGQGPGIMLGISVCIVTVLLVTGLLYFKHMERTLADVV